MPFSRSTQQHTFLKAVAVVGLLIMCGLHIVLVISFAANVLPLGGDANAYLAAARAILHGQLPIGENGTAFLPEAKAGIPPYLYPPLLALALIPLAILPYPAALSVWLILVAATTILLIYLLRPLVGWAVAIIGVLFFLPTWESLWLGQINALVAVLIAVMLRETDRRKDATLGVALALGTLLKVTPVLAALIFMYHRRWRSIAVAALTLVSIVILALPLVSLDAWYIGSLYALRSTERSAFFLSWTAILRNQPGQTSLIGPPVLIISMLMLTAWRSRFISFRFGLAATAILPLLISGIIWHYTAILALPVLAVLWQHTLRARLIALTTWTFITLIGGIWQPIMLSLCWCVCCWPHLLGPEDISDEQLLARE
ncbi:MAG: glycosyltransferase 87 family protein [Chloroflexales bacterium]